MIRITLAAALAAASLAVAAAPDAPAPVQLAQAAVHQGQGTVKAVDAKAGKINLDHGPIASLGWGAMAMDFPVKDAALLQGLKPGQKVTFDLASEGPGRFVVIRIAPVK